MSWVEVCFLFFLPEHSAFVSLSANHILLLVECKQAGWGFPLRFSNKQTETGRLHFVTLRRMVLIYQRKQKWSKNTLTTTYRCFAPVHKLRTAYCFLQMAVLTMRQFAFTGWYARQICYHAYNLNFGQSRAEWKELVTEICSQSVTCSSELSHAVFNVLSWQ